MAETENSSVKRRCQGQGFQSNRPVEQPADNLGGVFGAATGEVSLQTIQSKKAEALQTALQEFKKMPPLQQEQLSEWIVANFKPNTMQRVWGILKLVVSTFLLTILAQEPAVAFLKWFLKHFFNISY